MRSQAASSVQELPDGVFDLLGIPPLDRLTDDRARGADCVWCGARLAIETAVDLREQHSPEMRWFPRACGSCVGDRAHRALFTHAPMCEQCVDNGAVCSVGRLLYRLVREYRR